MSAAETLTTLVGQWTGNKRVYLGPDQPVRESLASMTVARIAQGKITTFQYTWSDEGNPQDGLLVVGDDKMSWADSWHVQDNLLILKVDGQAPLSATGSYSIGDGPEWGWKITIQPNADGTFAVIMYNIEPGEDPNLVVEIVLSRTA